MARIDAERIGAAGFSFGGYTMIAIAKGITSLAHFREFCASPDADGACQAPPEVGDLRAKAKALADSDEAFRAAYAAHISHAELTIYPGDVGHYVLCRGLHGSRARHPSGGASTRRPSTATRYTRRPRASPKRPLLAICDSASAPRAVRSRW